MRGRAMDSTGLRSDPCGLITQRSVVQIHPPQPNSCIRKGLEARFGGPFLHFGKDLGEKSVFHYPSLAIRCQRLAKFFGGDALILSTAGALAN